MWFLSFRFCKYVLLFFVVFYLPCTESHTRMLTDSTDVNEARLHEMELAIQYMKTQITSYDNLVNQIRTNVDELKKEIIDKSNQIGNLTTMVTALQRRAAFMAEVTGSYLHPIIGQHIVHDKVYINEGNGYHSYHGTFIAPIGGLYEFSMGVTVKIGSDKWTHINMMRNGIAIGYLFFDGLATGYPWLKETESILVHLNVGDEVWIQVTHVNGAVEIATTGMHTYFSGYLIQGDS